MTAYTQDHLALWSKMDTVALRLQARQMLCVLAKAKELGCPWANVTWDIGMATRYSLLRFYRKQWDDLLGAPVNPFVYPPDRPSMQTLLDLCALGNKEALDAYAWRHFDP